MPLSTTTALLLALVPSLPPSVPVPDGRVTVPLGHVRELLSTVAEAPPEPPRPPRAFVIVSRDLEGAFDRGQLVATLRTRFEVFDASGHVRVPLIDAAAAPGEARLGGAPTSILREGKLLTIGVDAPGTYEAVLPFHHGQTQDRFARRLQLGLPMGGPTRLHLRIPEPDITASLAGGAIVAQVAEAGDQTLVEGYLDASGWLDLSWTRRLDHERPGAPARLEAALDTLLTLRETLVEGATRLDMAVREGETDRLELQLPPGLEVLGVDGEAVLQWRTAITDGGGPTTLTVLLRYLVRDSVALRVRFQYPVTIESPVALLTPLTGAHVTLAGAVGVHAPAGLRVEVDRVEGAERLDPRDLPPALTALSEAPLLFGFAFEAAPSLAVRVARLAQVELTSTVVDDLEASTVVLADGSEVTKVALTIRNNARQYLHVDLPAGATLLHAQRDGQPIRPAVDGRGLLFPLLQSERVGQGEERRHTIRFGDTLGDLALRYYSDPTRWPLILQANRSQLADDTVHVGQVLRIPSPGGAQVEERSFVLELALWRRADGPLGHFGRRRLELPRLDVDALEATWHVYLPDDIRPLDFDASLTQLSRPRFGPVRRVIELLRRTLGGSIARAGGVEYQSILEQRRGIYRAEAGQKGVGEVAPGQFPLVGERYRFKRVLVSGEAPHVAVTYASRPAVVAVRWASLCLAAALALLLLAPRRRAWRWLVAAAGLAALLVVGHHVLGVHRHVLWGFDLALLWAIVRLARGLAWGELAELLRAPWRLGDLVRLPTLPWLLALWVLLAAALRFPELQAATIGLGLGFVWWHLTRHTQEVRHEG